MHIYVCIYIYNIYTYIYIYIYIYIIALAAALAAFAAAPRRPGLAGPASVLGLLFIIHRHAPTRRSRGRVVMLQCCNVCLFFYIILLLCFITLAAFYVLSNTVRNITLFYHPMS